MNKSNFILFLVFFLWASMPFSQNWKKVSAPESKMELEFPNEPKIETPKEDESITIEYKTIAKDIFYMAMAIVHNENSKMKDVPKENVTKLSVKAFAASVGGEIKNVDNTKFGKYKGRYALIENKKEVFTCHYQCVFVGPDHCQFIVTKSIGDPDDEKSRAKFFNSIIMN